MTEYKMVEGLDHYRVGDDGTVWSCAKRWKSGKWRKVKPVLNKDGYHKIGLTRRTNGIKEVRTVLIHTLVLECFRGTRPEGMECLHGNGNKTDNRLTNIKWGTHHENIADRQDHGTTAVGEKHGKSKLTDRQRETIAGRLRHGEKIKDLASEYGVSLAPINSISASLPNLVDLKRTKAIEHLESWQQSGKTQREYCKDNDINPATFSTWKKKWRK